MQLLLLRGIWAPELAMRCSCAVAAALRVAQALTWGRVGAVKYCAALRELGPQLGSQQR